MKRIEANCIITEVEQPQSRAAWENNQQPVIKYTVRANAYFEKISSLADWRRMCFVIDGELFIAILDGYNIGKEEYFVVPSRNDFNKRPKNINVYIY